jgi:alanine-synthesizing transaminase
VALSGGKPVHYVCDEGSDWNPDIDDLENKITAKTKAIVIINPNNPTGAVYEKDVLQRIAEIAERHGLVIFSDEIYDKILFDGAVHYPMATLVHDTLCVTFGGLSKNYRAAGFRGGWLILSGKNTMPSHTSKGLRFWPVCVYAPMHPHNMPFRLPSAAIRVSTTWCCQRDDCTSKLCSFTND